jgi:hypothetical protein
MVRIHSMELKVETLGFEVDPNTGELREARVFLF